MHLRLNRIQYPVYNLGTGKRIAIWYQGCTLGCPGCISPSLWNSEKGKDVPIPDLVMQIKQVASDYDGITLTGGEPMQQYEATIAFCALVKRLTNLDIYMFTGFTLAELEADHPDGGYRQYIDYMMDGRYAIADHDDSNKRGSSNQKLYRFVDGEAVEIEPEHEARNWSMNYADDGQLYMSGIPRRHELRTLMRQSKAMGINIRFS